MQRSIALACVGLLLLACVLPVIASAQDERAFPYGRWEGSAIGEGLDKEGKPKTPIAVKVWLSENKDGTVAMKVSTPAVPFAFSTKPATPQQVHGGWDVPVTVAYGSGKRAIKGSGILRLRQRADGWYAWGSGTGSALGSAEGSGHGSAKRVTEESSLVDQLVGPIKDTIESFTESATVAVPTEYPEPEFAEAPVETSAAGGAGGTDSSLNDGPALFFISVLLLILLIFGLDISPH